MTADHQRAWNPGHGPPRRSRHDCCRGPHTVRILANRRMVVSR